MTRRERLSSTFGYYAAYVALGMASAVLGPTLPGLAEHTGTQLSQISFLFAANGFGYLIGSYQNGRLYDRVPGHWVMAVGLLVVAVMLVTIPVVPLLWVLALAVLMLGVAGSAVDVGGNTLLIWVHGRKVGPYMNGLHLFFGLGAFLSPIIVAQAMAASNDITWAYWVLALIPVPVAIWLLRLSSPRAQTSPIGEASSEDEDWSADRATATRSYERTTIALVVVLFFLCVGAELGFSGWIFTYALAMDMATETTAAYLTSVFWGALTIGRLLGIPMALRFRPRSILLADLVGSLLSVGILLLWPTSWVATWVGAAGLGLSMASVFATLMTLAERRVPITGRTTGWFLIGSSLGGMFLPWLIGQLFESIGPQVTMAIIMFDLVAALGAFFVLVAYSARWQSLAEGLAYDRER